jgi:hypothetical protein
MAFLSKEDHESRLLLVDNGKQLHQVRSGMSQMQNLSEP